MKKLLTLIPAISLAVALIAAHPVAAAANGASHDKPEVVGTIHGRGVSNMMDLVAAGYKGGKCDPVNAAANRCTVSTFSIDVKLFSDHSARGKFDCVDIVGDPLGYPGDIFGDITSWSWDADGSVKLSIPNGTVVSIPGGDQFPAMALSFTVTIQHFGGAGVGHWTLDIPGAENASRFNGGPICQELLSRGHIVGKGEVFRRRDN